MRPTTIICYLALTKILLSASIHAQSEFVLRKSPENGIKLAVYLHDILQGPNQTVWEIARAEITAKSPTSFGQAKVVDDLITATPNPKSLKLGQAQGIVTFADLKASALHVSLNFYFTTGSLKGSSLSVLGRTDIAEKNRELAIVGGTGVFRMARGYAISNTYSFDVKTNYGIIEYVFYVNVRWGGKELKRASS